MRPISHIRDFRGFFSNSKLISFNNLTGDFSVFIVKKSLIFICTIMYTSGISSVFSSIFSKIGQKTQNVTVRE